MKRRISKKKKIKLAGGKKSLSEIWRCQAGKQDLDKFMVGGVAGIQVYQQTGEEKKLDSQSRNVFGLLWRTDDFCI